MRPFHTVTEIKAANKAAGQHYFEASTMRFFKSKVHAGVYGGRYFVTSEQAPYSFRKYTVREVHENGHISTVGAFNQIETLAEARAIARRLASYRVYEVYWTDTVGCYGTDSEGNPWATFALMGKQTVTCSECGAEIDGSVASMVRKRTFVQHIHVTLKGHKNERPIEYPYTCTGDRRNRPLLWRTWGGSDTRTARGYRR